MAALVKAEVIAANRDEAPVAVGRVVLTLVRNVSLRVWTRNIELWRGW